jgi:hypothetical protein
MRHDAQAGTLANSATMVPAESSPRNRIRVGRWFHVSLKKSEMMNTWREQSQWVAL